MMNEKIEKIKKAYELLKTYDGENTFIINLKNIVYAYKLRELKNYEIDYIILNFLKLI